MQIEKPAMAGTLESSDAQVTVEPGEDGIELHLESSVMNQYGRAIQRTVLETLNVSAFGLRVSRLWTRGRWTARFARVWNAPSFAVPVYPTRMFRGEV